MNRIRRILLSILGIILCLGLSSCSQGEHLDESKYMLDIEYKEDFRVLQLSDLHIANKDDRERQYTFLQETIDMANAKAQLANSRNVDFIIITGDLFTFATKDVAREMFSFFDKQQIPWTVTFGNHDEQCYFSIDWVTKYLNNLTTSGTSYCKFINNLGDDVYGDANFVINLKEGSTIKEQIYVFDSNRYHYGFDYIGYDYIRESQIEWYERMVNYTKTLNGGTVVKSMMFCHIPVPEYAYAYQQYLAGEAVIAHDGAQLEGNSVPQYNSGLFNKFKELGSTVAMFCGHDHINAWAYEYKGIVLGYGVNSTDRIYFDNDLLGGSVYIINLDKCDVATPPSDHSVIDYDPIIRSYDEYK